MKRIPDYSTMGQRNSGRVFDQILSKQPLKIEDKVMSLKLL